MNPIRGSLLATTALSLTVAALPAATGGTNATGGPQVVQFAANPCGASPCAANPCAANPCAARKRANPCAAGNPCGPCAAAALTTACVVPRLAKTVKANPCAAHKPCRPCAPRNPCGSAAARNPCNPCAARNPCNPCGPVPVRPPELTEAEATAVYACVGADMEKHYPRSGHPTAAVYRRWARFSRVPYPAEAHGVRFMNNYANAIARDAYGRWEGVGAMPAGSVLAKDSFIVSPGGGVSVGPLFVMTKQRAMTNPRTRDWLYEQILPDGSVRRGPDIQRFCNGCHRRAGARDDYLMFLPLPYRVVVKPGK